MSAALRLILAALPVWLALIVPNHPGAMTWGAFRMFPLELPAILLGLAALPRRGGPTTLVRAALTAALALSVLWRVADAATFTSFSRGFNPLIDLHLIEAGLRLATGERSKTEVLGLGDYEFVPWQIGAVM